MPGRYSAFAAASDPCRGMAEAVRDVPDRLPGWLLDEDDYTFYVPRVAPAGMPGPAGGHPDLSGRYAEYLKLLDGKPSRDCASGIFSNDPNVHKHCRVLACRCYAGQAIAVTVRKLNKKGLGAHKPPVRPAVPPEPWGANGYAEPPKGPPFAIPLEAVVGEIDRLAFEGAKLSGLVLVTGATNSAKSELTRGLISKLLGRQLDARPGRPPHLVTYEDPIEKPLFDDFLKAQHHGIEYTPRQKGIDVRSLKGAFDDALRQTPSVFYVGEVREDAEWKELVRFAGTGHLVVATAHAGSLVEAMERVFRGVNARMPAERGQVAQKVLAVVHQRMLDLHDSDKERLPPKVFKVLLPTLWRRKPAGVAALVSDGFASILPNNPEKADEETTSAFGRYWFAQGLHESAGATWPRLALAAKIEDGIGEALKKAGAGISAKQLAYDVAGAALDGGDDRESVERALRGPATLDALLGQVVAACAPLAEKAAVAREEAGRAKTALRIKAIELDLQGA